MVASFAAIHPLPNPSPRCFRFRLVTNYSAAKGRDEAGVEKLLERTHSPVVGSRWPGIDDEICLRRFRLASVTRRGFRAAPRPSGRWALRDEHDEAARCTTPRTRTGRRSARQAPLVVDAHPCGRPVDEASPPLFPQAGAFTCTQFWGSLLSLWSRSARPSSSIRAASDQAAARLDRLRGRGCPRR